MAKKINNKLVVSTVKKPKKKDLKGKSIIHEYQGIKNKTEFPEFIEILKHTQESLKTYLEKTLKEYGYNVDSADGFIMAMPNEETIKNKVYTPCILTAHMDRSPNQERKMNTFYEYKYEENGKIRHKISSPDGVCGDDRCGVWAILKVLKETDYRPIIIYNEDEEIGCVGSKKFAKSPYVNALSTANVCKFAIQIDRRGSNDAVFYDCDNRDFVDFIEGNTDFREEPGSYTDICEICPAVGIAGVNLSSGYYHEHTREEYIIVEEILYTTETVKDLCRLACDESTPQFEYIERNYFGHGFGYGGFFGNYDYMDSMGYAGGFYDMDPEDFINEHVSNITRDLGEDVYRARKQYDSINNEIRCIIRFLLPDGNIMERTYKGRDKVSIFGEFLLTHPNLCFNDIIHYQFMDDDDFSSYQDMLQFYSEEGI